MMTIKDNILEPYIIRIDNFNHTLIKKTKTKTGDDSEEVIGYYSSSQSALKKILKIGIHKGNDSVNLSDYIKRIEETFKVGKEIIDQSDLSKFQVEVIKTVIVKQK